MVGKANEWVIFNMTGVYGDKLTFWKYGTSIDNILVLELYDNGDVKINGSLYVNGTKRF